MRKPYIRPELTMLHLRPEEKLALCEWPVTHMTGGINDSCGDITWANLPEHADWCQTQYNNSESSGS